LLRDDADLREAMIDGSALLLKTARYDEATYRDWAKNLGYLVSPALHA
jgi:hypothetical protein